MIDVLYLVRLDVDDDAALKRMKCSVDSLPDDINLLVSDTSKEPLKDKIEVVLGRSFGYTHKYREGPYNRSYNINLGVCNLVENDFFYVSDVDIVYAPTHFDYCLTLTIDTNIECASFRMFKMDAIVLSSNYHELRKQPGRLVGSGGGCFCSKHVFKALNGFDEAYVGWGAEDSDFYTRVWYYDNRMLSRSNGSSPVVHLFHESFASEPNLIVKNRKRYVERCAMLKEGKLDPSAVNPDGWGL